MSYSKTIYDPCPPGYRVPDGGTNGVWAKASFSSNISGDFSNGYKFKIADDDKTAWYPAAGYLHLVGDLSGAGRYGFCWSASPLEDGYGAYALVFYYDYVDPALWSSCSLGQSVRCLKE